MAWVYADDRARARAFNFRFRRRGGRFLVGLFDLNFSRDAESQGEQQDEGGQELHFCLCRIALFTKVV